MKPAIEAKYPSKRTSTNQLGVTPMIGLGTVADRVPALIAVYNVNTGVFSYASRGIKKLLGYNPEDFIAGGVEFVSSLMHPEDMPAIMEKNTAALARANRQKVTGNDQESIVNFEFRMRHKNGRWVWLHCDGSVYNRNGDGLVENVLNISIDITERKKMEQKLQEQTSLLAQKGAQALKASEERYQAFMHNSREGIWRFEVDKPIPTKLKLNKQIDLMYKYAFLAEANQAMADMYGLKSPELLVGARLGDFLVRDDHQNVAYLSALIKSGYKLSGVESHEVDSSGNDKYFKNSLVGIIENGCLVRAWGTQSDVTDQHEANAELAKSEERLSLAMQASKLGIWEWNVETGELNWSDQLKRLFGFKPSDKIDYKKYFTRVHPEDSEHLQSVIDRARKNGKAYQVEHRAVWPDGSVHWIQGQGRAYKESGKTVRMIGTSMNIDSRKAAEAALQEAQMRYKTLTDSTVVGIFMPHKSGRIIEANDTYLKIAGYTRREMEAGKLRWDNRTPEEYHELDRRKHHELDIRRETTPWEKEYFRKDGSRIPVMISAVKFPHTEDISLAIAIDISERKEAERRLQESEKRFQTMADTAPVLIWLTNTKRECIYVNTYWIKYRGSKPGDDLGMGWLDAMHPDDRERIFKTQGAATSKHKPFITEYRLRRHDGVYRWILNHGTPRFSPDGKFLGYIGSCVDIDDVKRSAERRRKLEVKTAMLQQERKQLKALNYAKDEFISIASHQLRTPSTGVKQYVGMLLEGMGGELTEEQNMMLQRAYDSNERQLLIIDDLLRTARIDAGNVHLQKSICNFTGFLERIIEDQQHIYKMRRQKLSLHKPEENLMMHIDQRLVRMVVENIVDNASKYSPEGSAVIVSLKSKGGFAVLSIKDKGIGIAAKDQKKLFQKFSRIYNDQSATVTGSGLGLYWAKKIIDLHGGNIGVKSKLNSGSTFTISLPIK